MTVPVSWEMIEPRSGHFFGSIESGKAFMLEHRKIIEVMVQVASKRHE